MSAAPDSQGPSATGVALAAPPDGLSVSSAIESASCATLGGHTLSALPVGARLILRCRKDWREATVVAVALEAITLSVGSPGGHTYRVRRPSDAPLSFEGTIPVLGEGSWRAGLANYDKRW